MKRFLIFLSITFVVILGIFMAIASSLPRDFRVERKVVIQANTEEVHRYVGDLTQWEAWTPWTTVDPELTVTNGEVSQGVGATQSWDDKTGGGRLVITQSSPDAGVHYDLYFADFPKTLAGMDYAALPGGQTEVTWWMSGEIPTPVVGGVFASIMDSQVGPLFELGLQNLKAVAEESLGEAE